MWQLLLSTLVIGPTGIPSLHETPIPYTEQQACMAAKAVYLAPERRGEATVEVKGVVYTLKRVGAECTFKGRALPTAAFVDPEIPGATFGEVIEQGDPRPVARGGPIYGYPNAYRGTQAPPPPPSPFARPPVFKD